MKTLQKFTIPVGQLHFNFSMDEDTELLTVIQSLKDNFPEIWFTSTTDDSEKPFKVMSFVQYNEGHVLHDEPQKYLGCYWYNGEQRLVFVEDRISEFGLRGLEER